ncbi:MAG: RodZ domain-containing protein [Pseudomonadota bacterium]
MSEAETGAEQLSPGRVLAAARAELNLSVADVSHQIKYGVKQIAAIEADDHDKLPGATFVRGMIRSYAKLLHIDPQPLLVGLGRSDTPAAVTVDLHLNEPEPFLEGGRKSNRLYVYLSLVALTAVAAVAYEWYFSPPSTGEVVTITPKVAKIAEVPPAVAGEQPGAMDILAAAPGEPALASAPVVSRAGSGAKRIQLEFDELSWVEIKQANGKVLLSQLNAAGTMQVIEGVPPFEVVIGNAPKVRLTYDETPVNLRPYFKVDVARLTLD